MDETGSMGAASTTTQSDTKRRFPISDEKPVVCGHFLGFRHGASGEAHLRRILGEFVAYYNKSRTHRALSQDAPVHRAIERLGAITSRPVLGGLHHQYCRI